MIEYLDYRYLGGVLELNIADTRINIIEAQFMPLLKSIDFTNAPVTELNTSESQKLRVIRGCGSFLTQVETDCLVNLEELRLDFTLV